MNQTRTRVLIALDPVTGGAAALHAAALLGSEFGAAQVLGLYVEDAMLLRLARLPVVCEVTVDAGRQALAVERVEMQFRAQAGRVRALLEAEAGRAGLAFALQVARGEFGSELLRAATMADVLVLTHSRLEVARARARQLELDSLEDRFASGKRFEVKSFASNLK